MADLIIIGGGLAGSEAAWQAAERGIKVSLYEMRPGLSTGAHVTSDLAELVCSNSLGSNLPDRASGLLKEELRRLGSLLLECAEATALPAGGALAVDRESFSALVTKRITEHPNIQVIREEYTKIPAQPAIIASGPLTSDELARSIREWTGEESLYFFDAIAPIVAAETIDMSIAFRASRYGWNHPDQDGDYINCPMSEEEYDRFIHELTNAERIPIRSFETQIPAGVNAGAGEYFEGCLPIEVLARRGEQALAFGPMRPVGLKDPRTGNRPYAVVQLRQDNLIGSLYNIVGFQTNLLFPEQNRVLRLIPGLENAQFVRYGQMHRNTFIASPILLQDTLAANKRDDLFFAGQITGVEGYMGNIATGLLAGLNAARRFHGETPVTPPRVTMLGSLVHYITHAALQDFQPMKANYGILPELVGSPRIGKKQRAAAYGERALKALDRWLGEL